MRKRSTTIEWRIAENDQEWGQWAQTSGPTGSSPRCLPRWLVEGLLLILVLGGISSWQWYTGLGKLQLIETELTLAVQQEVAAGLSKSVAIKPVRPGGYPTPTIHLLDRQGDQAVVTVITPAIAQDSAYRQIQFYHHTGSGWQRTVPDAGVWGAPSQLDTASFRWLYQEHDAQVVAAVAPQLEAFYTTMRHNFGLINAPQPDRLVIAVSVSAPTRDLSPWISAAQPYIVASPALYRAPMTLTDAELLAQALALPLLNRVMAQTREHYRLPSTWQPLLDGLRLWQLWDLDLPLSLWRQEIVKGIYGEQAKADVGQGSVLPAHYAELCAAHTLWLSSPLLQINIPLTCSEFDQQMWYFATAGGRGLVWQLPYLGAQPTGVYAELSTQGVSQPSQTVILATLIEYAVTSYGRERLTVLVAGLQQHKSWETLLPAVYRVSAAEFEAGWQGYMALHYGELGTPLRLRQRTCMQCP